MDEQTPRSSDAAPKAPGSAVNRETREAVARRDARASGPRRWLYGAAALVVVLVIAVLAVGAINFARSITTGQDLALAPGQPQTALIPEPGTYAIDVYLDSLPAPERADAATPDQKTPFAGEIAIFSPTGERVLFAPRPLEQSVHAPGTGRERLGEFTTPARGEHTFSIEFPESTAPRAAAETAPVRINVRDTTQGPVAWAMVGFCFAAGLGGLALVALIALGVARLLRK